MHISISLNKKWSIVMFLTLEPQLIYNHYDIARYKQQNDAYHLQPLPRPGCVRVSQTLGKGRQK